MTVNRDNRVVRSFPNRDQQPYMLALEGRVSAIEAPDFTLAAPSFAIGTENANIIRVGVQLKDVAGAPLDHQAVVRVFTSTLIPGAASAVNTSAAISTQGTILQTEVTRAFWTILTNDGGYFDLLLGHTVAATFYLNIIWLDRLYTSPAITFV